MKVRLKTIDAIIDQRLTIRDAEGKQILFPSAKDLERVEKERIKKRNERLKEKEKRQKRTEEENKKAKATSFEKLKRDLLEEARREPQRNSSIFNFNEPTPGCRYDIGENHGYVLIPIDNLAEVIGPHAIGDTLYGDLIHEYTYSIAEQLFDNLGENWIYKL